MYILYGGDFTRSVLVQWVLEEGGIEYEFRKIDILKGEQGERIPSYQSGRLGACDDYALMDRHYLKQPR